MPDDADELGLVLLQKDGDDLALMNSCRLATGTGRDTSLPDLSDNGCLVIRDEG